MGYGLHWRHHVDRAQAADALEHRHTMGMPQRSRVRWADSNELRKAAAANMGCHCSDDADAKDKKKKKPEVDMGSVAEALEQVSSEDAAPDAAPDAAIGAPEDEAQAPSPSSSDQYVMLGEDAEVTEAVSLSERVEKAVGACGDDFERQPPMSEHFVKAFHQLVVAGAFEPGSQFNASARTIVREKMMAGDAGFRNVASQQLGEEACVGVFAVVDSVLQAE